MKKKGNDVCYSSYRMSSNSSTDTNAVPQIKKPEKIPFVLPPAPTGFTVTVITRDDKRVVVPNNVVRMLPSLDTVAEDMVSVGMTDVEITQPEITEFTFNQVIQFCQANELLYWKTVTPVNKKEDEFGLRRDKQRRNMESPPYLKDGSDFKILDWEDMRENLETDDFSNTTVMTDDQYARWKKSEPIIPAFDVLGNKFLYEKVCKMVGKDLMDMKDGASIRRMFDLPADLPDDIQKLCDEKLKFWGEDNSDIKVLQEIYQKVKTYVATTERPKWLKQSEEFERRLAAGETLSEAETKAKAYVDECLSLGDMTIEHLEPDYKPPEPVKKPKQKKQPKKEGEDVDSEDEDDSDDSDYEDSDDEEDSDTESESDSEDESAVKKESKKDESKEEVKAETKDETNEESSAEEEQESGSDDDE